MSNLQEELLLMGFEENMAQLAVANCNNGNLEDAINWILACSGDGDQSFSMAPPSHESLKLVLVVRSDLQMSAGKMAAQCVHAALAVARIVEVQNASSYANWRDGGEATICLRCASEEELNDLEGRARASGLPTSVVCDAGRTQVAPNTRTVLAIGPEVISRIDAVTGHLKLY